MNELYFKKSDVEKVIAGLPDGAEIMLVGDQGVYLMSFAAPPATRPLAFADGTNPDKDEDWHLEKRRLFGGDDGGDVIGTADEMRKIMAKVKRLLIIRLTETQIEVTHD